MVQDLGLSLSKLYPVDRPEPVTSALTDSTRTGASTPTDAVNPKPEVVEVQPPRYSIAPLIIQNLCKQKMFREIANYINSVHSLDLELHDLWRRNNAIYPGLYQLARVVHAVPATSAEIERVWSTYGLILSSRRSCVEPQNYKHWIFTRYNWDITRKFVFVVFFNSPTPYFV